MKYLDLEWFRTEFEPQLPGYRIKYRGASEFDPGGFEGVDIESDSLYTFIYIWKRPRNLHVAAWDPALNDHILPEIVYDAANQAELDAAMQEFLELLLWYQEKDSQ